MPHPAGSRNRPATPSERRFLELAQAHTEEALRSIVSIGRGEMKPSDAYLHRKGHHGKARKPTDTEGMNPFELKIENWVQKELARRYFIPWTMRLQAWIEVLNRGYGKPFQSQMGYVEENVKITFKDPEELRRKLIEQGVSPALLPDPKQLRLIDPDAFRRYAEEESERYLREIRRTREQH
jgi:hypothetical protein